MATKRRDGINDGQCLQNATFVSKLRDKGAEMDNINNQRYSDIYC